MTDDAMDLDGLEGPRFYPDEVRVSFSAEEADDVKNFISSSNYFSSKFDLNSDLLSMQRILLRGDAW